jgi:hypothetical protein
LWNLIKGYPPMYVNPLISTSESSSCIM